jgi:hypothetical protein
MFYTAEPIMRIPYNGGLLELGWKGLCKRRVTVLDTRFGVHNAHSRIGRSSIPSAFFPPQHATDTAVA